MSHILPAEDGSAARPLPVITALNGNNLEHTTSDQALKVTLYVHGPDGGPDRARPTVNGTPLRGSAGGARYIFEAPAGSTVAALTIKTRAGNNDLVIVEEF